MTFDDIISRLVVISQTEDRHIRIDANLARQRIIHLKRLIDADALNQAMVVAQQLETMIPISATDEIRDLRLAAMKILL